VPPYALVPRYVTLSLRFMYLAPRSSCARRLQIFHSGISTKPILSVKQKQQQTNSVAFSPQANYTDGVTATCWWNLVPTFVDSGASRGQRGGSPTVVNLSFLDRSRYFSFRYFLIHPHEGWVDLVPDPLLLRKSGSAGNRSWDLWISSQEVWPLDHRGGHRQCLF
jgi:hypothetical protein